METPTKLTEWQKLHALAARFYCESENRWQPKKGDYYTTPRADLELYQIVDEDEEYFYTMYCDKSRYGGEPTAAKWKKEEFLQGFGINRIHVHERILLPIKMTTTLERISDQHAEQVWRLAFWDNTPNNMKVIREDTGFILQNVRFRLHVCEDGVMECRQGDGEKSQSFNALAVVRFLKDQGYVFTI